MLHICSNLSTGCRALLRSTVGLMPGELMFCDLTTRGSLRTVAASKDVYLLYDDV